MITQDQVSTEAALASLRSACCPCCGGTKGTTKSLCRPCWGSLPRVLQAPLYAAIRRGYEEALFDALAYLDADTFHLPVQEVRS